MGAKIISLKSYLVEPHKIVRYLLLTHANLFKLIPDEIYIKLLFWGNFGRKLILDKYKKMSFNEKLQWLKLHDRKQIYTSLVDKYEFKNFILNEIGNNYIIPSIGVWKTFEEIDFNFLPNQFVLKCTHDSASVLVCRDKNLFNYNNAKKHFNKSLSRNMYWAGREWPYKNVKPRIIAEKYLEEFSGDISGLTDYKFHCFNGVPKFLYISKGLENHDTAFMSFYDLKGDELPFKRSDYNTFTKQLVMPPCFNKLIKLSEKVAKIIGSPFVRVDLLYINGQVYFSEVTFTPTSGLMQFDPMRWDMILGKLLKI
jgi:hypothetical protein